MGLSYLSPVNLKDRGIPASDLAVFRYHDFGVASYGLSVMVNPAFAAEKPEAVRSFLRALNAALRLAIKSPGSAIDNVLAHMANGAHDIELDRLQSILSDSVLTDEVRREGLGGINAERFAAAVDQLAEGVKFRKKPAPDDIFDGSFLPPKASRTLQQP
jgi:NitT/TauT family transport system substrate-binding protein